MNPGQASNNLVSFPSVCWRYPAVYWYKLGLIFYLRLKPSESVAHLRLHYWLLNNGLQLNPDKSEAITLCEPRSKPFQTLAESGRVHFCKERCIYHASDINQESGCKSWLKIILLTNCYLKYVKRQYFHIRFLAPHSIIYSPLMQKRQWLRL